MGHLQEHVFCICATAMYRKQHGAVAIPPAILGSRGESITVTEHPTKPLALPDRAALAADLLHQNQQPIPETLMSPFP